MESAAAVIAVSNGMKADVLSTYPSVDPDKVQVIHNGIDAQQYAPDPDIDVLEQYGVDSNRPNVVFVGRITRQKGVPVLLRAAARLDPEVQVVLCAGQPDTPDGPTLFGWPDTLVETDPAESPCPSLILLDLNMPKKDGREALQEIKADPRFRSIRVVIMTTSKAEEDVVRSYSLSAASYITKPVTFDGLVEVVKALGKYWLEIVELPPNNDPNRTA